MKLVSLNTWGATQGQPFFDYIKQQAKTTDIFCFQEIFLSQPPAPKISSNAHMYLFQELEEMLVDFQGVFSERSSGHDFKGHVDFPVFHGTAVFVKKAINISQKSVEVIRPYLPEQEPIDGVSAAQVLVLDFGGKNLSVLNYHGPARPGNKLDTEERIKASEKLKAVWQGLPSSAKILCGDFNLYPETQSVKILDALGKNLIKEFKIENTRNEVSWKRFNNKQYFADYIFVSPEVKVNNFEVPYNLVSDHLPMLLDFSL